MSYAALSTDVSSKDSKYQVACGKGVINLKELISLMQKLDTIKEANKKDLLVVVGNSGAGKSTTITYGLGHNLISCGGEMGLDHGEGLKIIFEQQTSKTFIQWSQNAKVGHVCVLPIFRQDLTIGWKILLVLKNKKLHERELSPKEIGSLDLPETNIPKKTEKKIRQYNLDRIFYFIRDSNLFDGILEKENLVFSPYLTIPFPEFKHSKNSQTTIAGVYRDRSNRIFADVAGFGDTRVIDFLETGRVKAGTVEETLMTTMSIKMMLDQASSIKGIIVVLGKEDAAGRMQGLLALFKNLLLCMPKVKTKEHLKTIAKSMVFVVTRISIDEKSERQDKLSENEIDQFEAHVSTVFNEVKTEVSHRVANVLEGEESYAQSLVNLANSVKGVIQLSEAKEKIKNGYFLVEDSELLSILEIFQEKILSSQVVYMNQADGTGASRELFATQLDKLQPAPFLKSEFQFSGVNQIEKTFFDGISLFATKAIDLIEERDVNIPKKIGCLHKELEHKNELRSKVSERITLLNEAITRGTITEETKGKMIDNLVEQKDNLDKQKIDKERQRTSIVAEIQDLKDSIKLLETDETPVSSDWQAFFSDKRVERHGFWGFYSLKGSSSFTCIYDKKDPDGNIIPYENIHVSYGDQEYHWGQYLKESKANDRSLGKYSAKYDCNTWYDHHPVITFSATIKQKYHTSTFNKIKEKRKQLRKKELELIGGYDILLMCFSERPSEENLKRISADHEDFPIVYKLTGNPDIYEIFGNSNGGVWKKTPLDNSIFVTATFVFPEPDNKIILTYEVANHLELYGQIKLKIAHTVTDLNGDITDLTTQIENKQTEIERIENGGEDLQDLGGDLEKANTEQGDIGFSICAIEFDIGILCTGISLVQENINQEYLLFEAIKKIGDMLNRTDNIFTNFKNHFSSLNPTQEKVVSFSSHASSAGFFKPKIESKKIEVDDITTLRQNLNLCLKVSDSPNMSELTRIREEARLLLLPINIKMAELQLELGMLANKKHALQEIEESVTRLMPADLTSASTLTY